jgi:general secretion pathway protein A
VPLRLKKVYLPYVLVGDSMYASFFNLKKKPFELLPDPEFIYLSRSHKKALTYLDHGIRERAGFILLTGEVGSGKTTLIRDLLQKKYDNVVLAKLFNTRLTSDQLLAMINEDFGLPVTGKDKITLIRELNDFLVEQYAAGKQPMLIVDEAQNLSADILEEVRMLSNLESAQGKLLQIMLVGQPELRETLDAPELLQLRQRISINCHLKALSREEMAEYILHRMEVAGNARALQFSPAALDLIHKESRGIPRLVNILCDYVMLSSFAEGSRSVSGELVQEIIRDLDFERNYWASSKQASPAVGALQEAQAQDRVIELAQRLESAQSESALRVAAAVREISDHLLRLKEEMGARVARCEDLVAEASARAAAAASEREQRELSSIRPAGGGSGFMRRLFRSAGSH